MITIFDNTGKVKSYTTDVKLQKFRACNRDDPVETGFAKYLQLCEGQDTMVCLVENPEKQPIPANANQIQWCIGPEEV